MIRVKTGQAEQVQGHAITKAGSGWGWQSILGLDCKGRYGRTRIHVCRTALGQAQDRALLGQGQSSASMTNALDRFGSTKLYMNMII